MSIRNEDNLSMLLPREKSFRKPRSPNSAYACFVEVHWKECRKRRRNESELFRYWSPKCAQKWKTMSEKEKESFEVMALADRKRYEMEMKTWRDMKKAFLDNLKLTKQDLGPTVTNPSKVTVKLCPPWKFMAKKQKLESPNPNEGLKYGITLEALQLNSKLTNKGKS